jgi:hypothetical protein
MALGSLAFSHASRTSALEVVWSLTATSTLLRTYYVMAKRAVLSVCFVPCFARSHAIASPLTSKALTRSVNRKPSSKLSHSAPLAVSHTCCCRSFGSTTTQNLYATRDRILRSKEENQEPPSWVDTSTDIPLQGTVTEIEVPGSGIFPLYESSS